MREELANIRITTLQNASKDNHYLISIDNCYFEASESTVMLLREILNADSVELGIKNFVSKHNEYDYEQISNIVTSQLFPKLKEQTKSKKQFIYQRTLVSADVFEIISNRLSCLFYPWVMFPIIILGITAIAFFFLTTDRITVFSSRVDTITIVLLILLLFCSSFFHELGHASATRYYGLKHGEIGFGLYLNFPVLYTDVSSIWQLPVYKRIIVNIAGVYFQILLVIGLILLYTFSESESVKFMIITMCFGFILTLNPFFKFDGYWIASDILGVPNLRRRSRELFRYFIVSTICRRPTLRPYLLEIKRDRRIFVIAYSVMVNIFMCYYFFYLIPLFLYGFFGNFPTGVKELIICLSNSIMPPFILIRNIFSQIIFFGLIIFMVYRMVVPHLHKMIKQNARER